MKLPNLKYLASKLSHVALLFDESEGGSCILGLGCKRSIELGGSLEGVQAFEALEKFTSPEKGKWTFGWMGYDLKNSFIDFKNENLNTLGLPDLAWWEPEVVIRWNSCGRPEVVQGNPDCELALKGVSAIESQAEEDEVKVEAGQVVWAWEKEEYVEKFNAVRDLIQAGDVYELNLCQTLKTTAPAKASWDIFSKLYSKTKAPFSAYMQCGSSRVLSGSPERFLKRKGSKLISQPIKGTTARGATPEEDARLIDELRNSEKERAENIMITDLVRNDLSRVAQRGTVEVVDLCGIHTFETVHQMITEVNCELDPEAELSDILKATFPMGSMTGAPKLSAMQNIEALEEKNRGIYSGSVGYISPEGDFDLSVLIRSLFHNAETEELEASVGGAITFLSNAEDEYNECRLKADALMKAVESDYS